MSLQKTGFFLTTLSLFLLYSCNGNKSAHKHLSSIVVNVEKVEQTTDRQPISASANIEGNKTVRLGFMVAGKINYIAANEGEQIKKGELLASLDPEDYQIAEEMASAKLDQTQDEYNRLNELYRRHSLSERNYSKIKNSLRIAKAQHHLKIKNLKDTRLYSPLHGILLKKRVETGEIIDKGIQLFTVADIYTVKANASVPEDELKSVHIGERANVYISALDSVFEGKIVEIGTLADPETRTFSVKVELHNPQLSVRPGMTAEVRFRSDKPVKGLTIPLQAVIHEPDNSFWVYVADSQKHKAFRREVALGKIIGSRVLVQSGLAASDSIVTAGQYRLSNGSSITIR